MHTLSYSLYLIPKYIFISHEIIPKIAHPITSSKLIFGKIFFHQVVGQNLHEAQKLQKKHRKLEAELQGHQSMIDKTVQQGAEFVKEGHPQATKVLSC